MNWNTIFIGALSAFYAGLCTYLWKQHRMMRAFVRELIEHNRSLALDHHRLVGLARALAFRVSPNGHVDLSVEELQDGELRIFKEEDEIRILAK